ncbi:hypothetical protein POSPLADRAFT_1048069 [Postia placenta MAD-698-R-SB12]|uniref:Uncharacterized protein n=1 Tax=Postia placenta MAD-698-R-SB12 TaxID=670580 RepID=A0A1X6MWE7_9APHY|nr:hypothetical protein POSPLADRAFT_1048069 [Postia placenta MAD-698-R-SB12]OSX60687.1 hypothetical protein POSPLADRAFT_1048069 [Postia placenta MAD-698-R-SB12]
MRANTSELEACSMPSPATVVNELLAQQAAEIATLRAKLESTQIHANNIRADLGAVQEKSSAEIISLRTELSELKMQHLDCISTMKKGQDTEPSELERALSKLEEQLDAERSEKKRELRETVEKTELEAVKLRDAAVIQAEVKKNPEVDVQKLAARIHGRELHMKHLESEGVQLIKESSTSEPPSLMSLLKSGAPPFDIFKGTFSPYGTTKKHITNDMYLLNSEDFMWCQAPYSGYLFRPKLVNSPSIFIRPVNWGLCSHKDAAELFCKSGNGILGDDLWYTGSYIIDQPEELSAEAFELLSEEIQKNIVEISFSWDLPHEETRAMYLRGESTVLAYPVLRVGYNANLKHLGWRYTFYPDIRHKTFVERKGFTGSSLGALDKCPHGQALLGRNMSQYQISLHMHRPHQLCGSNTDV